MKYATFLLLAFSLSAVAVPNMEELGVPEVDMDALEQALSLDEAQEYSWDKPAGCADIKLTDAQKQSLKTAFEGHKKAKAANLAALKTAGTDYVKSLTDTKGTKQTAETASTALGGAMAKLVTNHMGLANEILFDILTPDQRQPALVCMHRLHQHMKAMKLKKLCHANNPHHQQHQQHQQHGKPHPKPQKPVVKPEKPTEPKPEKPQPAPTPKP